MSDPMQEIRASFFIEAEELLESLQDALQTMDDGDGDSETINVAFRAVHSIKGGAGAFGLDQLVGFAHSYETVMDEVRAGRLAAEGDVMQVLFQAGDVLSDVVRVAREGDELPEADLAGILGQLDALVDKDEDEDTAAADFVPMGISLDLPGLDLPLDDGDGAADTEAGGDDAGWDDFAPDAVEEPVISGPRRVTIRFAPEPELYLSGNEPLLLIRALSPLGQVAVTCQIDTPPDIGELDLAQHSLLSWDIVLETDADDAAIREVFDFVEGLCQLTFSSTPLDPPDGPSDGPTESDPAPEDIDAAPDADNADEAAAPDIGGDLGAAPVEEDEKAEEKPADPAPAQPAASVAAPPKAPADRKGGAGGGDAKPGATVRVDLVRVDRLVNLVGELVINQSMLAQSIAASGLSGNSKIAAHLDEFQQLTRDIQDSVMMIRAQPVKSLFQRMARIVREASAAVDKQVKFRTEGESTEIDKTVIERLADPLTHMIRNAVDHGLEDTEARINAGKSQEGTVTLSASHRSGRVLIEVSDDGGGINRPRVKSIAEEKGLIPPDLDISDSEIDNLLFLPGFSTAKEVSNLSGRGVGMDVVKSAITQLGGRISIASTPGSGTTFSISLPLTLAVLDGMVVRVRDEMLVVPLNAISETLSVGAEDVRGLGPNTQVLKVRDVFVPLIDLGYELGYSQPRADYKGSIVLLIQHEDGKQAAVVVDGIEDQRQVVIKGLQDSYGHVPGVAAATILGDGQIALILDAADLLANATGFSRGEAVPAPPPGPDGDPDEDTAAEASENARVAAR